MDNPRSMHPINRPPGFPGDLRDPHTIRDHLQQRCSLLDVLASQPPREGLQAALARLEKAVNEKEGGKH